MDSLGSVALRDLKQAASRPGARPSAARLLPGTSVAEGIPRLERLLRRVPDGAPGALAGAAAELIGAGGKRVRPLLALLAARAANPGQRSRGRVALALSAELIHSATLLHDDVIDDGLTRRGLPAPRVAYGNGVSVLAGDWLLTSALDLALRSRVPGAVEALVRALRELVAGEARQLALRGRTDFTPEDALEVARLKTGALFAYCGEAGALAARAGEAVVHALRAFGGHAGVAFQISDDLLDFEADERELGKAVLADVAEGKPSLPLAIALQRLAPLREEFATLFADSRRLEDLHRAGDGKLVGPTAQAPREALLLRTRAFATRLSRTGALVAARRIAEQERDLALAALSSIPSSPTRELLAQVATVLLERNS